jgi:SAM-dependent methyltransferase
MAVIDSFFPGWRDMAIHECSPAQRGASARLRAQCRGYVPSHYFEGVTAGAIHQSYRCENLEALTFADQTFDLHVSQDVFEHLFDPGAALREIARTLKTGGAHVFTVPLVRKHEPTRRRALRSGSDIKHFLPAEYHGNPIDEKGSLVTFDYGFDIADLIQRATGMTTTIVYIDDLTRGIRAEYIEVCVSRRSGAVSDALA